MKWVTGMITTTHVDRAGDRMMLSALESALDQINRSFVPVGVEHDPRIPPIGRLVRASIRQLDDGEYALEGEMELFEAGDVFPPPTTGEREIPIHHYPPDALEVTFDRQFREEEDLRIINDIGALFDSGHREDVRKSLQPITILTVGGAFIMGAIASGFLARLGEDGYEALKAKLKALFARRNRQSQEALLRLNFVVMVGNSEIEVEVIASRPDDNSIEELLNRELATLDKVLPRLIDPQVGMKRLVFEYLDGRLKLQFGVRRDAVPLFPNWGKGDREA